MNALIPDISTKEVRSALGVLIRLGLEGLWTDRASLLLELPTLTRGIVGLPHDEALEVVRENLDSAIREVPSVSYQDLLRIVLGLDPEAAQMPAGKRRAMAGKRFRSGRRPVRGDTIRQYHEPQALEQLAAVLLGKAPEGRQSRRRKAGSEQRKSVSSFGNPDAARVDLEDVLEDFIPVDFAGMGFRGDPRELNSRVRLIIGRKGSGKTLYLRRLSLIQAKNGGVYTDDVATYPPRTDLVVRVAHCYPEPFLVQKWQELWRVAILRSAISHLIYAPRLRSSLADLDREQLQDVYKGLGGHGSTPHPIGGELTDILASHHHASSLDGYLANPIIDDAEYWLQETVRNTPPLFFYIDALDDEYQQAPYQWLQCQKGLFLQVMRLDRDPRLSRLKVTAALRDVVYAALARSEHATRYVDNPSVVNLRWTPDLARGFLEAKVRRLDSSLLLHESEEPTLSDWLGRETITSDDGSREVPLATYLVEHTRALPRDIVQVGNRLCREVRLVLAGGTGLSDARVREIVHDASRLFGLEQLSITATQIISKLIPEVSVDGYEDIYGSKSAYAEGTVESLAALLTPYLSQPSLTPDDLEELDRSYREELGLGEITGMEITGMLWENDLLGVEGLQGDVKFRYEASGEELRMPFAASRYRLHPILRAALAP